MKISHIYDRAIQVSSSKANAASSIDTMVEIIVYQAAKIVHICISTIKHDGEIDKIIPIKTLDVQKIGENITGEFGVIRDEKSIVYPGSKSLEDILNQEEVRLIQNILRRFNGKAKRC